MTPWTNFGTDAKGFWARCLQCYQKYYDWDAAKHIALCKKCRPGEASPAPSKEPSAT